MFYEHQASSIQAFEENVHLVFWSRVDRRPKPSAPTGDTLGDIVGTFKRLKHHFHETPDVHVAIDINEEEAWVGVACARYGIALFFRYDADGSRHVWSSVNGLFQDVHGYETQMRRIRTVLGSPHRISEHDCVTGRHIVDRLLGGPGVTTRLYTDEEATAG